MNLLKRRHSKTSEPRRTSLRRENYDVATAFRRGRTLTGSASSSVHALSESQADLKSPRVHAHALTKQRHKLFLAFLAASTISSALYVLIIQFTVQPVVQASPDTSLSLDSKYADSIDDYLSGHITERWRLFTNVDRLETHLQKAAPEVKTIQSRGSVGFGESLFEITFREPIASWEVNGQRLYVDAEGVPFSRNYFASPSLQVTDQSGMTAMSGQTVMSNRFMSYTGQVIGLAKEQGYTVASIVIPEGMTRQIHVYVNGVEYPFKFTSDRPAGEGVEDMVRAHKWMKARGLTPEYVDVRVSGRAFYR